MIEGSLEIFVVILTRVATRLKESMFYIDHMLHTLVDWGIDFKFEVEGL